MAFGKTMDHTIYIFFCIYTVNSETNKKQLRFREQMTLFLQRIINFKAESDVTGLEVIWSTKYQP